MTAAMVQRPAAPARRVHMRQRSRDWNLGLAEDLRDPKFAREFLVAAMDDGVPIQIALGKVIRAMGVKEFAGKVRMTSANVLRAIHLRQNPRQDTLNRLLKPFRLKLSLAKARQPKRVTKAEGVAVNQLINVAVAEKVSALRTEEYFAERAAKCDVKQAIALLKRSGKAGAAMAGDELPSFPKGRKR